MEVNPNTTWSVHQWLQLGAKDFCRVIPRRGPYPYPNIGTSMGPVSRMLEVLRRNNQIVLEEDVNDQGAMWLVILRHANELNIVIDQHAQVFMNMLEYEPGELEREPCNSDWFTPEANGSRPFGRTRSPPRNLLTNTTPAILHFNGPSHEDSTWPKCYHAFTSEFRTTGRGHYFFDVDHNIHVGTDAICDYSFYHVRDFHVHPLNQDVLRFLEDFYKLPVDPGLVAFRGSSAEVDSTRLGREIDLHTQSPHLHKALHGGVSH